ncbi:PPC domain-containing DNA-binding protein [Roseomonas sp. 18066]|uniref:PPC domain-containing DNA-binding protein n=1 Tax=Roseomonas sp. 18066 TaxID=2681412 RepID=UPI00190F9034|nr:PPC domain-containing DNA-binding protein [Roseomonas sp. 18066]
MTEQKRYIPTPTGFLMVLRQGDDLFAQLKALAEAEAIPAASITGFGFAGHVSFGFFDFDTAQYRPRDWRDVEIASLTGSLAWREGQPALHAHGVASDAEFRCFGGHLLGLVVGRGSLELTITLLPSWLERAIEPEIGAQVLQLGLQPG